MFSHIMKKFGYILLFFGLTVYGQETKMSSEQRAVIAFYNLENLYDTLNDVWKNDEDFTPEGLNRWTGERYREKISRLARAISAIGVESCKDGAAVLGMCEVENKSVIEDLVKDPALVKRHYAIVHLEGPDARGVDPSFIYQPQYFEPQKSVTYAVHPSRDTAHKTRDILVISGLLKGEAVCILINHWPSRRGGELRSRGSRNIAAKKARWIADSVMRDDPACRVVIMGDLNDDPVNECVKKHIGTYRNARRPVAGFFYNPMEDMYLKGIGTLAYKDSWNLFDQILLNNVWLSAAEGWRYESVHIHNKSWLRTDFGNFKGYPFRSYSGGVYTAGYSDHFASYIVVKRR